MKEEKGFSCGWSHEVDLQFGVPIAWGDAWTVGRLPFTRTCF